MFLDSQILRVKANVAQSQTDSVVSAATTGKVKRVLSAVLTGPTATPVTFNSKPSGSGVAISATFTPGPNAVVLPHNPHGWFDTVSGEGLTVTTGSGGTTGIHVVLAEI